MAAPTIVLVHGAWHGGWCWSKVAGHLEGEGFSVVSVDLPGHETPGSSRRFWNTLSSYVEHVGAVVDDIAGDVVLVGHSMGGLITQRVLEKRSVARGVLVASVPRRGVSGAVLRMLRSEPKQLLESVGSFSLWPMVSDDERVRHNFFAPGADEAEVVAAGKLLQNESYVAFLQMILGGSKPSRVSSPVSVIAAEHDTIFTLDEQRDLAAAYGAELKVIDAGHDIMLDQRWQELGDEIARLSNL